MNDAFAIVVTFHPSEDVPANVSLLRGEGLRVLVVDNGSPRSGVTDALAELDGVEWIRLPLNLGIATALNVGIQLAMARGARWLFTFDQDSRIAPGYASRMRDRFELAEQTYGDVALLAPWFVDAASDEPISKRSPSAPVEEVAHAMSSGNLFRRETFERAGLFADELFMDFVDIEFCLRCRSKNMRVVQATDVELRHRLGALEQFTFAGIPLRSSHHPASRVYYRTRNRIRAELRYAATEPEWAASDLVQLIGDAAKLIFEEKRAEKLLATLRGVVDGLRGQSGVRR